MMARTGKVTRTVVCPMVAYVDAAFGMIGMPLP